MRGLLVMTCFTLGLGSAVPCAPPNQQATPVYAPTKVGARWVYKWSQDKDKNAEVVEVVSAVEENEGARIITVSRVNENGKLIPSVQWLVTDAGLFRTKRFFGRPDKRPTTLLQLPHSPGQTWTLEDTDPQVTMTAQGPERVKVPAGEYEAIRVEQRDERSPDPQVTRWYAPGVGLVKLEQKGLVITLKSFTPGK
jgi:hypothetical protein